MKRFKAIYFVLLAGLFHGLLYVFLLPPWQHYDEPGHFEAIWLIANRPGLPSPGEYDQAMRREVAASMIEHGFFKDLDIRPNLLSQQDPIWIGFSQTDTPSLYYWLTALPLRLVQSTDITFQLYICRLISLLFYIITVVAAYGVVAELTPSGNPTRWLLPAMLVLLPGFNDLMTAVNNDVGAVAFFSLFLWASLVMLRRGFSLPRLIMVSLLAGACFYTKNTAAIAVPLLIFPVLLSLLRGPKQAIAWALIGVGVFVSIFFIFTSGDVAYWYQPVSQITPTRTASPETAHGSYAFQLDTSSGVKTLNLLQLISSDQVQRLRGKKVTLGYWIWANQPVKYHSPVLKSDEQVFSEYISITQNPTFHAFTARIIDNTNHLQIELNAPEKNGEVIYFDGLVLANGDYSQSDKPVMVDEGGQQFVWGGKSFVNPIRNASAEQVWPRPRTTILRLLNKMSPIQPNMVLASLADWENSRWYYHSTVKLLFRTFWGQFGWGHISFNRYIYIAISILTASGLLGAVVRFWRNRKEISWDIFILLAVSVLGIWGAALVRGIYSIAGSIFIPSARYTYPAIIPTVWVLWSGWSEWPHLFTRWLYIPNRVKITLFFALFLFFDALSIWTIAHFYGKI